MNYENTYLTTYTYIKESFEEIVMILLLIVCTFCLFLIQLFTRHVVGLPFYNNYAHHLVNIKRMVEYPLTKKKIGIHPTKVLSFGSSLPMQEDKCITSKDILENKYQTMCLFIHNLIKYMSFCILKN